MTHKHWWMVGLSWLQLIVPQPLRSDIVKEAHQGISGGHLGQEKTLHRIKQRFYWPGYFNDVRNWCASCHSCTTRKTPAPSQHAPLGTITAGYPMQIVAADLLGPLPESENGNSYILVVADYFTRWMEAFALPNQEATTVANKLVDEVFLRFSVPEQLHTDQGRQFESQLLHEVCKLLNIHKTRTTPYHPQSDGLVERLNRTLLSMFLLTGSTTYAKCAWLTIAVCSHPQATPHFISCLGARHNFQWISFTDPHAPHLLIGLSIVSP